MVSKTALAAAMAATIWSPAVSGELRRYTVTVVEQVRHEITVEANEEYAARIVALLEARRTSGSSNPAWKPAPPAVLAHAHDVNTFAVIAIEPLPMGAAPEPSRSSVPFEVDALER